MHENQSNVISDSMFQLIKNGTLRLNQWSKSFHVNCSAKARDDRKRQNCGKYRRENQLAQSTLSRKDAYGIQEWYEKTNPGGGR